MKKLLALASASLSTSVFADGLVSSAPAAGGQPSSLPSILMLVVFVLIFYFLLIRPQMKRSKEQRQLLGALEKGDEVVTAGGLFGKVAKVEDAAIELEIADKVIVKIQKQAVVSLIPKGSVESK